MLRRCAVLLCCAAFVAVAQSQTGTSSQVRLDKTRGQLLLQDKPFLILGGELLPLLWFGSWKSAFSEYAPDWVKADTERFPPDSVGTLAVKPA